MAQHLSDLQNAYQGAQTNLDNWNKDYYNQKAIYTSNPNNHQASLNMASDQQHVAAASAIRDSAYKAVADYQNQISLVVAQNVAALQSDPSFQLSKIQAEAAAQAVTTKANADAAAATAAANSKRTVYIIVGAAFGLAMVVALFIYVFNKEKAAAKSE